ncbi:MAG: Dyp-type peroxidase [Bacteroidota bacterium]
MILEQSSGVSLNDPKFDSLLSNLQANILKFHGRNFAYHLFFSLDGEQSAMARLWISGFANSSITSSKKQLEDSKNFKSGKLLDGGTVFTLSLSNSGFTKLNLRDRLPDDASFKSGLKASAGLLKDDPSSWEMGFKGEIDMLIIVADDDATRAKTAADDVISKVLGFATLLQSQRGNVLKMTNGVGIEHFGYADGISQPMYLADEINGQSRPRAWDDETILGRLLVKELGNGEDDLFGSYLVFRKLEQDVKGFKDAEKNRGPLGMGLPEVLNSSDQADDELPGAMIVGRFENGTPVNMMDNAFEPNPHHPTNDFSYEGDPGLKCPFHAHIRLMNPRKGDPETNPEQLLTHRVTRRGIPYDDMEPKRLTDDEGLAITEEMLEAKPKPSGGVGLLFMCYQSSISNAFEILQAHWSQGNIAPSPTNKGQDSIILQGTELERKLPKKWGEADQGASFKFSGFVKMKGGEYFFTPSIHFLKQLTHTSSI